MVQDSDGEEIRPGDFVRVTPASGPTIAEVTATHPGLAGREVAGRYFLNDRPFAQFFAPGDCLVVMRADGTEPGETEDDEEEDLAPDGSDSALAADDAADAAGSSPGTGAPSVPGGRRPRRRRRR